MGQWWPASGLGILSVAVHTWDLLKEVTIISITSTIVWPQVNSREKTLMLGGIGGRRRRGRQDEMAGWHHRLDGR